MGNKKNIDKININKIVREIKDLIASEKKGSINVAKSIRAFYNPVRYKNRIYFSIEVCWRAIRHRKTIGFDIDDCIYSAVLKSQEIRNETEKKVGKPRTEKKLYFSKIDDRAKYSAGIIYRNMKYIGAITEDNDYFVARPRNKENEYIEKRFYIKELGRLKAYDMAKEFYEANHYSRKEKYITKLAKIGYKPSETDRVVNRIKKLMIESELGANKTKKSYKIKKYIYFYTTGISHCLQTEMKLGKSPKYTRQYSLFDYEPEEAFYRALLCRNKKLDQHNIVKTERVVMESRGTATGYPGICKKYEKTKTGERILHYNVACKDVNGKRIERRFSVKKYGKTRAIKEALDFYKNNHYLGGKYFINRYYEEYNKIVGKIKRIESIDNFVSGFLKVNPQYLNPLEYKFTSIGRCIAITTRDGNNIPVVRAVCYRSRHKEKDEIKKFALYPVYNPIDRFLEAVKWRNTIEKKLGRPKKNIKVLKDYTESVADYDGIKLRHFKYCDDGKNYKLISVQALDKGGSILEAKLLVNVKK